MSLHKRRGLPRSQSVIIIDMRQRRLRRADAVPSNRLAFIEGMRGIAALYVVLGHFASMADPRAFQHKPSFAPEWVQNAMAPLWYGHLAVAAFIAISGYCLQMSLFNGRDGKIGSLSRFFARRARRILPPYYACLGLSILVCIYVTSTQHGMPFDQYLPLTSENIWAHVLMIHNLSAEWMYKINGVLWSISAEAQLYLLFPILVWMVAKFGRNLSLLTSVVACWAILQAFPNTIKLYPWYLALFTLGIVAAHLAYRPLNSGVKPVAATIVGVASFAACLTSVFLDQPMPFSDGLIALSCASFMYAGSVAPHNFVTKIFGWRPVAWLGAISYSLYLMHHPIEQIVYVYRPSAIQGEAAIFQYLILVGLPVVLFGCTVFWFCFERPFVKRLRSSSKEPKRAQTMTIAAYVDDAQFDVLASRT